jgi:hypothetical protein
MTSATIADLEAQKFLFYPSPLRFRALSSRLNLPAWCMRFVRLALSRAAETGRKTRPGSPRKRGRSAEPRVLDRQPDRPARRVGGEAQVVGRRLRQPHIALGPAVKAFASLAIQLGCARCRRRVALADLNRASACYPGSRAPGASLTKRRRKRVRRGIHRSRGTVA